VQENHVTQALEELLQALEVLRRSTRASEATIRRALTGSYNGMEITDAVLAAQPAASRGSMNDALKAVEVARHRLRLAVFAAALDDGVSIGELGRMFGFSRQLAARYAKEARGPGPTVMRLVAAAV
jgi:hypothetical protein